MPEDGACATILIHGAWQGSWAWDLLKPYLDAAGIRALAVDLPGNGRDGRAPEQIRLQDYLDYLDLLITSQPGPVALAGHSGGGIFASLAAERHAERVERLVYVAGMMLPNGMGYADLLGETLGAEALATTGIVPHLRWSPDRAVSWVEPDAARTVFFSDCPAPLAEQLAVRLTGQPEAGRAVRPHLTPQRFGRIPRLYIEALNDRSIPLAMQRRMQELSPGAQRISLPTGHVPQASRPDLLADAMVPFLTGPLPAPQPLFGHAS